MGKLTCLIGDIHGEWDTYHQTATDAVNFGGCERTIQVGDFGIGFDEIEKEVDNYTSNTTREVSNG